MTIDLTWNGTYILNESALCDYIDSHDRLKVERDRLAYQQKNSEYDTAEHNLALSRAHAKIDRLTNECDRLTKELADVRRDKFHVDATNYFSAADPEVKP